ncbi:cystin-1 isoform X1 [Mauremys reevesii]|uniref:cystin-1 isoform X1 n=1 Tax=Mauremys reevesii TaxID=260615 RepID=UPI00193EE14E|nr:cystin-1 isoform X1 [Mauremys reevesii]
MGSGSSRRKRSCSPGADRPGRRGRSSSAPSGQGEEAKGSQAPAPTELPSSSLRRPQPAEDSDWELLEEVLAECEEPGALPPTARGPAAPSPGPPRRGPAGDSWAGHDRHPRAAAAAAGSGRGSGAAGGDQPVSLTRSMQDPENNNSASFQLEVTRSPRCNPQYRTITLKKSSWRVLNKSTAAESPCCTIIADSGIYEQGFCQQNSPPHSEIVLKKWKRRE